MVTKKKKSSRTQAPDDIEKAVVDSMTNQLNGLSPLSRQCCINKVPERLRCVKKKAYTPQAVSIGPLHHEDKDLLYMEEHKQRYLQHFLHRIRVKTKEDLEVYVKKIVAKKASLSGCYDGEASEFNSDEFVSIILVDAAFIIELLLRSYYQPSEDDNDWIFTKPWMLQNIAPDMILLENQLPFFILEYLFADVGSNWDNAEELPSLVRLSYVFFQKTVHLQGNEDNLKDIISSRLEVKHFVDLIRTLHQPSSKSSQTGGPTSCCSPKVKHFCDGIRGFLSTKKPQTERPLNTPCAKKLHQAGVKLQVSSSKNLFDISFNINKGILEIPQVEIHDYTELTLRNLLAFEQCHCTENHIRDYLRFMDGLVNTPMDVDLLVEHGIFVNTLGDNNKVSILINKLCVGVSSNNENYYFADLSKDLNNYCGKPWNKSKASLKQKYFNTPWAMISVFAAGFLIVLTVIQTVCTIISVIN
ncbi:UPF0481 protein At3g47200-like [Malus sylvestris]|uniref:UPF0481 protein At3g47200-like n=1 Tax=Malus sylvestris TaxID=3752 RepID=UPI0021ACF7D2|nr:UPF0481 protein At3g47200-like [Malus sylvestris]